MKNRPPRARHLRRRPKTLSKTALFVLGACALLAGTSSGQTPEERFFEWTDLPFDEAVFAGRRARMIDALRADGGGVFLVPARTGVSHGFTFRQTDDFLYLTGLETPDAVLALDADAGTATLFVPPRDARFESAARPNDFPGRPLGDDPELARRSGLADVRPVAALGDAVAAWTAEGRTLRVDAGRRGVGPVATSFTFAWSPAEAMLFHLQRTYPKARIRDAFPAVARVRMIKGPEEIAAIRRVCDLTVAAIRHAAAFVRDGVTERTLEAELEAAYKRGGAQRLAFASIIKSGPNALWPWRILAAHYDRRNRAMHTGELVIFDVGTELDYYVSDVGRTFPVSGRFTPEQRRILSMEVAVADAVIAAIRPGVTFAELTETARAAIPPAERPYMQTGLYFGHHLGLNTGDPSLPDAPLAPGMVFTVEPWYYNHDLGLSVFTEDVILVTEDGAEVLTAALPRTPEALERMVAARR